MFTLVIRVLFPFQEVGPPWEFNLLLRHYDYMYTFFLLSKIALTINLLLGHEFCLGAEKRVKCEIYEILDIEFH